MVIDWMFRFCRSVKLERRYMDTPEKCISLFLLSDMEMFQLELNVLPSYLAVNDNQKIFFDLSQTLTPEMCSTGFVSLFKFQGTPNTCFSSAFSSYPKTLKRPADSSPVRKRPAKRIQASPLTQDVPCESSSFVDPSKDGSVPGVTSGLQLPSQKLSDLFGECVAGGEKFLMCLNCSYKSKDRGNMTRHVQNQHGIARSYVCSTCGKSFRERNRLKVHYIKEHKLAEPIAKAAATMS